MKNLSLFLFICLLTSSYSCSPNDPEENVLTIHVNRKYPKIKLKLQDLAEIEYIPLGFHPDFLANSRVLVLNDKHIAMKGGKGGEILIFDRQGNPVTTISYRGNGPHEYIYVTNLLIDEKREEVYIHDVVLQKIFVYTLEGNFTREYPAGDGRFIYHLNEDEFLFYNIETILVNSQKPPYYSRVSKEDGSVLEEIRLPFDQTKVHKLEVSKDGLIYKTTHLPTIRYFDEFNLNELSSDTIYKYASSGELSPFIVRQPQINSMDSPVYLQCGVETRQYIFMSLISINEKEDRDMFPSIDLVYDKEAKAIYEYELINEEYPDFHLNFGPQIMEGDFIAGHGVTRINPARLVDDYKEGKVYGRLKEIAATLDEEDNFVVMLLKFK